MNTTPEFDSSIKEFRIELASRGYRMTEARRVVLKALSAAGGHVTADEIVDLIHTGGSRVGRMTVYRTLDLLTELGLVRPVYQGTGAAHYILLINGHHHHLVCTRCHAVVDVDSCILQNLENQVSEHVDFEIQGHLLELFGICPQCRDKST